MTGEDVLPMTGPGTLRPGRPTTAGATMSALGELRRIKGTSAPKSRKQNKAAFLFLLPWFIGLALITVGPMVASFALSFTRYNLLSRPSSSASRTSCGCCRTSGCTRRSPSPSSTCSSRCRCSSRSRSRWRCCSTGAARAAFYRSVFYLPSLLGASVAIAMLWRQIFGSDGLVNSVLALVRHRGPGLDLRPRRPRSARSSCSRLDVRRADGDLPRRAAADPRHVLRGGIGRRRRPLAAVPHDHAADAHADHLLQPGAADHRGVPVVHPGVHRLGRHRRPGRTRRCSTRCTSTSRASRTSTWATPRRWPGCCW